jgi:archaellin
MATVGVVFVAAGLAVVLVPAQLVAAHRAATTVSTRVDLPASGTCCVRARASAAAHRRTAGARELKSRRDR